MLVFGIRPRKDFEKYVGWCWKHFTGIPSRNQPAAACVVRPLNEGIMPIDKRPLLVALRRLAAQASGRILLAKCVTGRYVSRSEYISMHVSFT
jgi:hypothetical protein